MDFNKLNYLIAVAELKSFSKAAEKCFVSQPALTRCVKNIEEELGVKLFDRSCSPIKLTFAGERYIAGMKEILEMKIKLDQEMADIAARKKDRLIIGIAPTRSITWLPRVLPAFHRAYPDVDIQIVEANAYTLEQYLAKGTIDLYLMATEPILAKGLVLTPFYQEEMMVVVSRSASILHDIHLPENRPNTLQYIPPEVLEHIPFLSVTASQGCYYFAHRIFDQFDIQPSRMLEFGNATVAYQMAPSTHGFAFAPVTVSYEETFEQEPLFCTPSLTALHRTVGILHQDINELSDAAKGFRDIAIREISHFAKKQIPEFKVLQDIDFTALL